MPAQIDPNPFSALFDISVVIPTYNRRDSLLETLASLSDQTLAASRFEVIIVDDGSTDDTAGIVSRTWPFSLQYVSQQNQGAAAARNHGAQLSKGRTLVFIDDDITLEPDYLHAVLPADHRESKLIRMGVFLPYLTDNDTVFARLYFRVNPNQRPHDRDLPLSFVDCVSNNLVIDRQGFFDVGMWHDILGDGPTLWGDVEFGYRAWKSGFQFLQVAGAKLYHRDYTLRDLSAACERNYRVSKMASVLGQRHPELVQHLTMFTDKGPIFFAADPPFLVARKMARMALSSPPSVWAMKKLAHFLEDREVTSSILVLLYRWIISAYIYRGYRHGLCDLAKT